MCTYFVEKAYPYATPKEWWLTEMVAFNFLQAININFKALQVESGVVSKQYDNLHALLDQLQTQCTAIRVKERSLDLLLKFGSEMSMGTSEISMGQLLMTVNDIQQLLNGIDIYASEILAHMTDVH